MTTATVPTENALPIRRWIVIALVLSMLIHLIVFIYSRYIHLHSPEVRENKPDLRKFMTTRVTMDQKFFKTLPLPAEMPVPPALTDPPHVTVDRAALAQEERRTLQKLTQSAIIDAASPPPSQEVPVVTDRPQIALPENPQSSLKQLPASQAFNDVDKIHQNSLGKIPTATPKLPDPNADIPGTGVAGNGTSTDGAPGFQRIAQLLNKKPEEVVQAVKKGLAIPIGDKVLFDYDKFDLKPGADPLLKEIVFLISTQFSPKAIIQIDGFTDSSGPDDYNLQLSKSRAEAVRDWLIKRGGLPADRIQARGLGKSNFIVSPKASIEEQAPNRRTEIRLIQNN
ncbi:MAG: OmpA family protein [Verrucomicrobiae bacterium]|nr:OmpA family protein [Verrucomicrobiae bacterium]